MKGYRTLIWNAANAGILAMEVTDASYAIPQEWMPIWLSVYIVGNFVLRLRTTGPVGSKD